MIEHKTNNTVQAFWVALGSFCAFGVSILSTIILSRYFDKAGYGTYRQVLYVYQILLAVFTLGLPKAYAYFLPRVKESEAKSLIKKITLLFYLLGGLFSLLLFLFSPQIALILKNPQLELALKVFSPVPFLLLPTMGLEGIFAAYQKNKYMALYNVVTKSLILICVALPVIIWNGTYIEALTGFVVASFISFLIANYLKYWCVKAQQEQTTTVSYQEIVKFALPLLLASLGGILFVSADNFFISRYFGAQVFAEFANGSLELPFVGMLINACSTVLLPLFSERMYKNQCPRMAILPTWISVFKKTIMLTYPLILFFIVYADTIMEFLYGAAYAASGTYFRIKLMVNFFTVISYFPILVALGATKLYWRVQVVAAVILIILEYASILVFHSPYAITVISVLCKIGIIVVFLIYISRHLQVGFFDIIPMRMVVTVVLPALGILLAIRGVFSLYPDAFDALMVLLISFSLYILSFFFWSKLVKLNYYSIVQPVINKTIKNIE